MSYRGNDFPCGPLTSRTPPVQILPVCGGGRSERHWRHMANHTIFFEYRFFLRSVFGLLVYYFQKSCNRWTASLNSFGECLVVIKSPNSFNKKPILLSLIFLPLPPYNIRVRTIS